MSRDWARKKYTGHFFSRGPSAAWSGEKEHTGNKQRWASKLLSKVRKSINSWVNSAARYAGSQIANPLNFTKHCTMLSY
jgi:hypothetical protein